MPQFFDGSKGRMERQRLLLVEGHDDAYFLDPILTDLGASQDEVGVVYLEGKTKLQANLGALLKSRFYQQGKVSTYAVIGDSDTDPAVRIDEIRSAFVANGQPSPSPEGFVVNGDGTRAGLFLIPSASEEGDLEKLCLRTLGDDALLKKCSVFAASIEEVHGKFPHPHKSLAQIYLACRPEDTRGVGRSFYDGIFDRTHVALDPLKEFLKEFLS